jgi:hypothetical protein
LVSIVTRRQVLCDKFKMHRTVFNWHRRFDPMQIVGVDAKIGPVHDSLAARGKMAPEDCFSLRGDSH